MIEVLLGAGLGLISGYIVAIIAKEELEIGTKYFNLMKWLFFVLIAGVISYSLFLVKYTLILSSFLLLMIILILLRHSFALFIGESLFLASIIFASFFIKNTLNLMLISSSLFCYNLFFGTLIYLKIRQNKMKKYSLK